MKRCVNHCVTRDCVDRCFAAGLSKDMGETKLYKRLKLAEIASKNSDLFDAGITDWNKRLKKTGNGNLDILDESTLPFGLIDKKDNVEKSKYKYIINVEGHSAAYRLNFELGLGSVVLMVESKYYVWFKFLL